MNYTQETIVALSTSSGTGALGVIRISGPQSWNLVQSHFSKNIMEQKSHTVHFGNFLRSDGSTLDEVLLSVFKEGRSYTGESTVEISCHASPYIQNAILEALTGSGARLAEAGEFSQRAFLNGKLDLSQAEAVADLIASQSKQAHEVALKQLKGQFSNHLQTLREKLIHFAAMIELELDFGEEDVEFADRTQLKALVGEVLDMVARLADSFALGNALKNGVPVAIVGAPNTGKSTLLNQLLGEDRAIVSPTAGTTRDVIEETLNIEGILFRLIDTAGIRETEESIEAMGIERSLKKIEQAGIVLCMADASAEHSIAETLLWKQELEIKYPDKKIELVVNKVDLSPVELRHGLSLSAKEGQGIDALKSRLVELTVGNFDLQNDIIVANARHHEALVKTGVSLNQALQGLETGTSADFIAMDIRAAMRQLGNITGHIDLDTDILGAIFSKFCIGK